MTAIPLLYNQLLPSTLGLHLELNVTHQVNLESYLGIDLGSVVVSTFHLLCLQMTGSLHQVDSDHSFHLLHSDQDMGVDYYIHLYRVHSWIYGLCLLTGSEKGWVWGSLNSET